MILAILNASKHPTDNLTTGTSPCKIHLYTRSELTPPPWSLDPVNLTQAIMYNCYTQRPCRLAPKRNITSINQPISPPHTHNSNTGRRYRTQPSTPKLYSWLPMCCMHPRCHMGKRCPAVWWMWWMWPMDTQGLHGHVYKSIQQAWTDINNMDL